MARRRRKGSRARRTGRGGQATPAVAAGHGTAAGQGIDGARFPERALIFCLHAALALVLLTPIVAAPEIMHPYSVGKALWTRPLIAVAFVLWAVLAAVRPGALRPRFSITLALLAAWFAAGMLAAFFGVSPQRSLWSGYVRMQGLVDTAHWVVFAALLAATLRTGAEWRRFLNIGLGVGLLVAVLGIARFHLPNTAVFGWWPEPYFPRISVLFGNPLYLGASMQAVALLAFGMWLRSLLGAPASPAARAFWLLTGLGALWGLALSGSLGAFGGVCAGAGAAALFYAALGPSPGLRRAGGIALGGLALGTAAVVAVMVLRSAAPVQEGIAFETPLMERVTSAERVSSTLGTRLDNWSAGLEAFAARPVLGWGPENYLVAASRYDETAGVTNRARDHAHNQAVEEAATKGIVGLSAWLALWGWTFLVLVRAARRAEPPEMALIVFAGAALFGWLVQSMTAFYTAGSWLQHMVLLGFVSHLETGFGPGGAQWRRRLGAWFDPLARMRPFARMPVRAAGAVLALVLAAGSLASSLAIHQGSAALYRAQHTGPFIAELGRAIDAFGPFAVFPRILLFENVAPNWPVYLDHDEGTAFRLLAVAETHAAPALAAEPENWQLHHALAKMYAAVADTHPEYRARADYFHRRSLEIAPYQDPLMPGQPQTLGEWQR